MEVEKSIEATIMDYIRFFPEEVQNDYEVMLRRCNFHDATDPCFPIMLFLLFFQESICEKMEQLDLIVRETRDEIRKKQAVPVSGASQRRRRFRIAVILLAGGSLLLAAGGMAYHAFRERPPRIATVSEDSKQNALREMNRYWIGKLEEEEQNISVFRSRERIRGIAVGLGGSALFSLIVLMVLMRKLRKYEMRSAAGADRLSEVGRKKRIFQLFSRIARSPEMPEKNNSPENKPMK